MGKKGLKLATQKLQDLSKETMTDALNKVTSKDKPKQSKLKKGIRNSMQNLSKLVAKNKKRIKELEEIRSSEVYKRLNRKVNKDKKSDIELSAEKELYELGAGTAYKPKD